MSKTFIQAIAIAAMLLSPSLASARVAGPSVTPKIGNVGTIRVTTVPERTQRLQPHVKLFKCHTYERRNPWNDTVVTRTVCH